MTERLVRYESKVDTKRQIDEKIHHDESHNTIDGVFREVVQPLGSFWNGNTPVWARQAIGASSMWRLI
jgi:hypothetical protein